MSPRSTHKSAFTLLEILLAVGIIAILAGIVIVALNPTKQFAQVRNTQRKANLSELNKALYQYYIDNSRYPTSVPSTNLGEICNTGASSTPTGINCTGLVDLSPLVPTYLVAIPTDPQATGTSTGYLVAKNTANKIYVKASNAELSQTVALGPSDGILPDHLVSYWSFDGNANDSQGTNHGTVSGAVLATGVKGQANTAYSFDGVDDYMQKSSPSSLPTGNNPFTISAWVKLGTTSTTNKWGISSFGNAGSYGWNTFRLHQTALGHSGWGYDIDCNITNSYNVWTFVTITFNTSSRTLYQNGNFVCTQDSSLLNVASSGNLYVGRTTHPSPDYFNGSIDNVRIYNKALSAEEVLNIYNAEKP